MDRASGCAGSVAARRDAVTPELVADFQASKEYGLAHIEEIAANAAATLGLPQAHLESYLRETTRGFSR